MRTFLRLRFRRDVRTLVAVLLAAAPAAGQPAERTPEEVARGVDGIFAFATPETPGCAVGVSQNGRVLVERAYGLADVERGVPLSPGTAFDIGSVQKQFVAAAVLLLAQEGRLSLSDEVRTHLPELPDYGHRLTVDHLLTHTGGLRDWTGLLPMAPEGSDVLELILRQRGLDFVPGEEWSYSNSGYVLLKEIVARASGTTFAEFARRRLFEPLGMRSSAYVADILQGTGERALAYERQGAGWREFMRLGNRRGGGAVITTVRDLLVWNDALASGRLGAFVTGGLEEAARLGSGRRLTYGRGVNVNQVAGGRMVSHSGGAAGYGTWLGRFTDHGLSIAVMCNFEPISTSGLASRVADLFLPPADPAARPPGPVAVPGVEVSGREGLFFERNTGAALRLLVNDGRLVVAGAPPLVPVGADRFRPARTSLFFRSEDDFELTFRGNDELELRSMEGRVARYRRAEPWTPTAADLQGVEGRYGSDELGAVFELLPGAGGLVVRFEGDPDRSVELAPVERDTWMQSLMIVRLRRDASGRVTGFDYGNPLVRSLAFTRVGDRTASAPPAVLPDAASAAPRLEALAGEYELAPGRTLTVTLEEGGLHGQPPGGEKRALLHVSGATFSVAGSGTTLTFTLGAGGVATAAVMRQGERERTLPRVR